MSSTAATPALVVASRNRKKCAELAPLLGAVGIGVVSVAEFEDVPEVVEDGESFSENAAKKASETARFLSRWTVGEDSGLAVDALGGAPGIFSARYSGENATDASNNQKLIEALDGVEKDQRGAGYICNVALSDPDGKIRLQVERTCRGCITTDARGTNGFGYDPYFLIPEYHRTFGELSPLVKSQLSHRARALSVFTAQVIKLFRDEMSPS